MNLVFVTVLLFLFFIPGIVFRLSYFTTPFSRRIADTSLLNDITWSIIPGIIIHILGSIFLVTFTNYSINFPYIGSLLLSTSDKQLIHEIFTNIQRQIQPILFYNLSLIAIASVIGLILKSIVRKTKLDRKTRLFRFSNKWYYIFTGECLDFPHVNDRFENIDLRLVNILCQVGNEQIIYIGELFDYYLDSKGEIDTIQIRHPMRRNLRDDNNFQYYDIPSRYLIIPYKNIININVRYFAIFQPITP